MSRCASILAGCICPDDLCRNASDETLCGASVDDIGRDDDYEFDDEFGLCMDPCEHPSVNGDGTGRMICAACGDTIAAPPGGAE